MVLLKMDARQVDELKKKSYGIVGGHSAVQICDWTKRSIRDEDECYKRWFYGVETFSCAQMTPNAMWCDQNCIFCWRPAENMLKKTITEDVEDTKSIIEGVIEEKKKLLMGFKGLDKANKEKVRIALEEFPSHWAISLSGEPTLYPKLSELIKELKSHKEVKSVFLVTNGQNPEVIEKLKKEGALPTQLYVSLDASTEDEYRLINRGIREDGWSRLLESLKMLKDLPTRTVIRLTLIKGMNTNESQLKRFSEIIEDSQPDFVEVKAYMHIGYSRKRLDMSNMPTHEEVKTFGEELIKNMPSFEYEDEQRKSRIILYSNKKKGKSRWIIKPQEWRAPIKRSE